MNRSTRQGLARGQVDRDGDYNAWADPGSHAAATWRDRARGPESSELVGPVLGSCSAPCFLCEPGRVCTLCQGARS